MKRKTEIIKQIIYLQDDLAPMRALVYGMLISERSWLYSSFDVSTTTYANHENPSVRAACTEINNKIRNVRALFKNIQEITTENNFSSKEKVNVQ